MRKTLIALLLLLPTLAFAGPKELLGTWQIQLSEDDKAQIAALKMAAEQGAGEDGLSKAMLKTVLLLGETKLVFTDDTMTVRFGDTETPAKYTSTGEKGSWTLTTTTADGGAATLQVSLKGDILTMDDGKKPQSFRKLP